MASKLLAVRMQVHWHEAIAPPVDHCVLGRWVLWHACR